MRGNPRGARGLLPFPRSIPACAGEPSTPQGIATASRVYPRVCGGTALSLSKWPALTGLSPRVRGNPTLEVPVNTPIGSIPACAGEPHEFLTHIQPVGVYPRVCGGTPATAPTTRSLQGLSPRVRGNPLPYLTTCWPLGSIPACAGEPFPCKVGVPYAAVYPRVCGGTIHIGVKSEPWFRRTGSRLPGVYPRVCGGTLHTLPAPPLWSGLSPRVRGNPPGERQVSLRSGSIPACAGEPPRMAISEMRFQVYPRVCGGTGFCNLTPRCE